jgi:hypothetical protein
MEETPMTTTYLSEVQTPRINVQLWTGRVITTIVVLFLAMDTVMHLLRPAVAVEGTVKLGFAAAILLPLGIIEAISLILYLIPRTAALGALIWTGYLGGAVATHVRAGNPLFTHILMPVFVAILLWGGLALRDRRIFNLFK